MMDGPKDLIERVRTNRTLDSREDLLRKHGMAGRSEDGVWHPTVAGVLMAGPDPRTWIPSAFIQAVAYRGTTVVPEDGPRRSGGDRSHA